jgi:S1-C subfamily serine protease
VYEQLAYHQNINDIARLAAMSLIRPSITYGHLSDIVGDKIVYDAPTAHGASGGPVLNPEGEVVGVDSAYLDGFSGSTLGIAVEKLRPLVKQMRRPDQ